MLSGGERRFKLLSDVIVLPECAPGYPDRWLLMNVFSRTCLGAGGSLVEVLGNVDGKTLEELREWHDSRPLTIWEIEFFSHSQGLLADPTRFVRKPDQWGEGQSVSLEEGIKKLQEHFIITNDEAAYQKRFQPKKSLLDRERFGNYHQQLGQFLLLKQRVKPAEWWVKQKFSDDGSNVREDSLYGAVQDHFLRSYFPKKLSSAHRVLDVGCGTGYYSRLMAETGADVLGIDPCEEYILSAGNPPRANLRFERRDIGVSDALNGIPDESMDFVFMCDALLFYFVPVVAEDKPDIRALTADLRRVLKPDGIFVSVEPHSAFYLAPWFGSETRPFTVISEYARRGFGITPPLGKLIQTLNREGFWVSSFEELFPDSGFEKIDPRAYHFACEFPVWHLMEMRKAPTGEMRETK